MRVGDALGDKWVSESPVGVSKLRSPRLLREGHHPRCTSRKDSFYAGIERQVEEREYGVALVGCQWSSKSAQILE